MKQSDVGGHLVAGLQQEDLRLRGVDVAKVLGERAPRDHALDTVFDDTAETTCSDLFIAALTLIASLWPNPIRCHEASAGVTEYFPGKANPC